MLVNGVFKLGEGKIIADLGFKSDYSSSITRSHRDSSFAPDAVNCNQSRVSGFEEIAKDGFHASMTGSAHSESKGIGGLEDVLDAGFNIIHYLKKKGMKCFIGCIGFKTKVKIINCSSTKELVTLFFCWFQAF